MYLAGAIRRSPTYIFLLSNVSPFGIATDTVDGVYILCSLRYEVRSCVGVLRCRSVDVQISAFRKSMQQQHEPRPPSLRGRSGRWVCGWSGRSRASTVAFGAPEEQARTDTSSEMKVALHVGRTCEYVCTSGGHPLVSAVLRHPVLGGLWHHFQA